MIDKELLEQFQMLAGMMEKMATKRELHDAIDQAEWRINMKIEHEVTKRIDALFDGYKLTHEKQYELERPMEKLEQVVNELQSKIA